MDAIDKKIVETLQERARIPNVELARMCNLAPSSMHERVRRLEKRGVIKNYRAMVDPESLGYHLQAMIMITIDRHQTKRLDEFEHRIANVPEIKTCYMLAGHYDFLVHVVVRDIDHLRELISHSLAGIDVVERQETFLIMGVAKEDQGYSLEAGGIAK